MLATLSPTNSARRLGQAARSLASSEFSAQAELHLMVLFTFNSLAAYSLALFLGAFA